jgi:hypothetical protein
MPSRMSLGGGSETRGVLGDGASRYNSSLSLSARRRQSFGGREEDETPQKSHTSILETYEVRGGGFLGDSAPRRRSVSAPRRQTMDAQQSETPQKDRRAMLAAWRQARATGNPDGGENKKRTRGLDTPPLPPSAYASAGTPSSATADLSSYTVRKQRKVQQEMDDTISLSHASAGCQSTIQYYDGDSASDDRAGGSLLTSRTPSGKRRGLGAAARRKSSALPPRSVVNAAEGTYEHRGGKLALFNNLSS